MSETKTPATWLEIRDAVLAIWLDTGQPVDVPSIATRLQVSDSTVRKRINDAHGAVPGTDYTEVERPTYSRDYPTMQTGRYRRTGAWLPSRSHLRDIIRASR